ncbi:MAG: LCP family protein, partial [Parasporobacterium sp.]|nr:LCP family protein [Parasporobacterium sp.]
QQTDNQDGAGTTGQPNVNPAGMDTASPTDYQQQDGDAKPDNTNGTATSSQTTGQQSENTGTASSTTTTTTADTTKVKHEIKNIAFFGMSVSEVGGIDTDRSDMIIIVSVDIDRNRVALTSVLRDSKVPIEGHSPQKINAAYKYGGAPLAIKTLNQNFHLDIADYVTVNFENLIEIVDYMGGVDIELTAAEASQVPGTVDGMNHLDGKKTLAYVSIRKIDSDFYRASRQQTVLMELLKKIKDKAKTEYPEIIRKFMNCMETSLTYGEILDIVTSLDVPNIKVDQITVPDKNFETNLKGGLDETGSWVYTFDIEEVADRIHRNIYGSGIKKNK